jgi:glycosyltransferase involved in cell wall biosynthesis
MSRKSICLVSNEMYPFLPGGIGRLMYNFCERNVERGHPVDLHFLLPAAGGSQQEEEIRAAYAGKARIHFAPAQSDLNDPLSWAVRHGNAHHPEFAVHYSEAWLYHHGLLRAEQALGRPFDLVEWPDFGGWSSAALQAREVGFAHRGTVFAYRLHSSQGLITDAERYSHHPSQWFGALLDLERQGLAQSDLIVGHLSSIVDANAQHYRFDEDWAREAIVEFPPITVDPHSSNPEVALGATPDFIFSSRLQPFKRPDIFIRAAVMFFERNPDYPGVCRVVSYGWDRSYIDWLKSHVPPSLADRVLFLEQCSKSERLDYLARSVVVVPSTYESLCLFAYEAGQMGLRVILNRECRAFSEADRWIDEETCLFFDGDFIDLAHTMERACNWVPTKPVSIEADAPYWEDADLLESRKNALTAQTSGDKSTEIPVLVYGIDSVQEMNRVWSYWRDAVTEDVQVHFLVARHAFEGMETAVATMTAMGWSAHMFSGRKIAASELQRFIESLEVPYVCLCPSNSVLHPDFLPAARHCFANRPDTELFSAHCRVLDPVSFADRGVTLSTGDAQSLAMLESAVSAPACVVSREAVSRIGLDDMARELWFAAFTRKLALSNARIVIAPRLLVDRFDVDIVPPNNKPFSAGVFDSFGVQQGLVPRLLAFDAKHSTARSQRRVRFAEDKITETFPVHPKADMLGWSLVQGHQEGILVSPHTDGIVIAELKAAHEGHPIEITGAVRNTTENNGVEVALLAADHPLNADEINALESGETHLSGASPLTWHEVASNELKVIRMIPGLMNSRHIYFLSRAPAGRSASGCAPVWRWLELGY